VTTHLDKTSYYGTLSVSLGRSFRLKEVRAAPLGGEQTIIEHFHEVLVASNIKLLL